MVNQLSEDLKKILLAGIGAAASAAEKAEDIVEQLVKKGELTVQQGKILNQELKYNPAVRVRPEPVRVVPEKECSEAESVDISTLSREQLEALRLKIDAALHAEEDEAKDSHGQANNG